MHTTPPTLLEKLRDPHDGESWNRFVGLYAPFFFYLARLWKLNDEDTDDFVQEVFAKLVQVLPRFIYDPTKGRFRSWLRTVCFHCWSDLREKREHRIVPIPDGEMGNFAAPDDGLEQVWEKEYTDFLVRQAMRLCDSYEDDIDPQTLLAFREVMLNHRPVSEVAMEMDLTPNAVSLAKFRVLRKLRHDLERFLD